MAVALLCCAPAWALGDLRLRRCPLGREGATALAGALMLCPALTRCAPPRCDRWPILNAGQC